jgi:pimeloyl-ACP methyl ester carboxylesterase
MTGSLEGLKSSTINGAVLAWRENGSGEPVIFVHGSASDVRTWAKQIPAIGENYRAVAFSRRYARPNENIEANTDDQMLPHVDDLIAFMQEIGAERAHLVGHSWGGFIALLAAIKFPQNVRSLVLLEPPVLSLFVSTPPKPSEILCLFLRDPRLALAIVRFGAMAFGPAKKAYQRGDDEAAMRAFGHGVLGKAAFEGLSAERLQQVRDNRNADRAQILGAGFPPLEGAQVRRVQVPALLLVGERSPTFLRRLSNRLHQLLTGSNLIEVPDASHLMHEDNADYVNEAIMEFLGRQAA